jgi:membrane protein YqaA with SNARE-associated domain
MKWYDCLEKMIALLCLTGIAIYAMTKLNDPENVVINVVVAIASFISGGAVGYLQGVRRPDPPPTSP